MSKTTKIISFIFLLFIIFCTLLAGCNSNTNHSSTTNTETIINLNNYLTIDFGGLNGKESPSYSLNIAQLVRDLYPHTIGLYDEYTLENTLYGKDNHGINVFIIYADKHTDLTNSDIVQLSWAINERGLCLLQEQVPNVKFVYSNVTIDWLDEE